MKTQKISREEEAQIPKFNSHKEARDWFIDRYGPDFILTGAEEIGEEMCYFYYLILNWEDFQEGRKEVQLNHNVVAGLNFLYSHQPIQIMESGSVHIVH